MLKAVPELDTLVVPIGGGGLISGIAIAAKIVEAGHSRYRRRGRALSLDVQRHQDGEHLPMRGDTLAEGIAVKSPGKITTEIIRHLVDDIVLVTEAEIECAVATLINIEKTVVEGAGAAGLAAVLANPALLCRPQGRSGADRRQYRHAADCLGPDPRARARGTADAAIARYRRPARPIGCGRRLLAEAGANIIEVSHQRTFSDLPAKATLLQLVIETRDRAHLEEVLDQIERSRAGRPLYLIRD